MTRTEIIRRVRSLTRDITNSIFREQDIIDFINEGVNRFIQVIPELRNMELLHIKGQTPNLLPAQYHHLLAIYSASRCFGQDERHYQATTFMNEFETKLNELKIDIENGDVIIVDENGDLVSKDNEMDYVDLKPYWNE